MHGLRASVRYVRQRTDPVWEPVYFKSRPRRIGSGDVITPGNQTQASQPKETEMKIQATIAAVVTALSLLVVSGCAVTRDQETVGAYIDDAAITTSIKARFVDNKQVDASSIKVETLNGTVMLSGFAKNATEKDTAESIARQVKGVKAVRNEIVIRP